MRITPRIYPYFTRKKLVIQVVYENINIFMKNNERERQGLFVYDIICTVVYMTLCRIKECVFGQGKVKICVPLVETKEEMLLSEAKRMQEYCFDVVEWRMDYYEEVTDYKKVVAILEKLKNIFYDRILLVTFRTKKEGGERAFTFVQYKELYEAILKSNLTDMIDIEMGMEEDIKKKLIHFAHEKQVKVILSNHEFLYTPDIHTLFERGLCMIKDGADIVKFAVMPKNQKDVLNLLDFTMQFHEQYPNTSLITMSMGKLGAVSRICGEAFGSCMTFGTLGKTSAPGQIECEQLKQATMIIHNNIK